jgi:hypothetical protein
VTADAGRFDVNGDTAGSQRCARAIHGVTHGPQVGVRGDDSDGAAPALDRRHEFLLTGEDTGREVGDPAAHDQFGRPFAQLADQRRNDCAVYEIHRRRQAQAAAEAFVGEILERGRQLEIPGPGVVNDQRHSIAERHPVAVRITQPVRDLRSDQAPWQGS